MWDHEEVPTTYVSFPLEDGSYENMHAVKTGAGTYILRNSPFYVYDVSLGDELAARIEGDRVLFDHVVARSGHSTYRVRYFASDVSAPFEKWFEALSELGCSFEGGGKSSVERFSIDVPPSSDINQVYTILEDSESAGLIEFEEAHFFRPM